MSTNGARILIIDDELQIRRLLRVTLQAHGFEIVESSNGEDGLMQAAMSRPDLIILDLGLPDTSGIDVLKRIREWSNVPVIVLTVRDREADKVTLLDSGADDYMTKPFGMGELLARIRVALRHVAGSPTEPVLTFGELVIDLAKRTVHRSGQLVKLTRTEYELLKVLATHAGRVMTHQQLLQQVWGSSDDDFDSQYLRVYVGHLRKKLEEDATRPKYIITEPGIGYRFADFD